jgi:hypothetical protein
MSFMDELRMAQEFCVSGELTEAAALTERRMGAVRGLLTSAVIVIEAMEQETERQRRALEKLLSYNEDVLARRINYRAEDHIAVARAGLDDACPTPPTDAESKTP